MGNSNVTVHCSFLEDGKDAEEILMASFRAYLRRILGLEGCETELAPR